MATKKKPSPGTRKKTAPSWQVILEEMRSQNRATIEAADARHEEMREEVRKFRGEVHAEVGLISMAVQSHSIDLRGLKTGLGELRKKLASLDAKLEGVAGKMDKIVALDERVLALERRWNVIFRLRGWPSRYCGSSCSGSVGMAWS